MYGPSRNLIYISVPIPPETSKGVHCASEGMLSDQFLVPFQKSGDSGREVESFPDLEGYFNWRRNSYHFISALLRCAVDGQGGAYKSWRHSYNPPERIFCEVAAQRRAAVKTSLSVRR